MAAAVVGQLLTHSSISCGEREVTERLSLSLRVANDLFVHSTCLFAGSMIGGIST